MSTASWRGVELIIRNQLLTFTPSGGGSSLATRLGSTSSGAGSDGKLFFDQAPDNVSGFWGVLHLVDAPLQGFDGGLQVVATAELILYGRPRKTQAQVEAMADVVMEAWHAFTYTEVGGHISAHRVANRFTIPYTEPADRELVAVRLLLPFRCSPIFLTRYAG
jgi:hypothetical protein